MTTATLNATHNATHTATHTATPTPHHRIASKLATEAIGTLFLVFTIGACVRGGAALAPLGIGAVLMVMVYAGGHVSGAHYNPAVTLAVLVRRRIDLRDAIGYWIAQFAGALGGAILVAAVVPRGHTEPLALSGHTLVAAVAAEFLITFALCYVVLNVATSRDHPDNSFYGLAIGFTVAAGAIAVGGISGGAFNPAVVLAGIAMGLLSPQVLVIYIAGQALAAVAAGMAFRALNPTDN
jgi:aquaporin Z